MPLRLAQKTTPIEAARVASLPDDYVDLVGSIDRSDQFAYECINMGVPVGTATAINNAITRTLNKAGVAKPTHDEIQHMRAQCKPENAQWTTWNTTESDTRMSMTSCAHQVTNTVLTRALP